MKDSIKVIGQFFVVVIVILFGICLVVGGLPVVVRRLTMPKMHEVTSPLNAEVAHDLCQKLNLSEDDPPCRPGAIVFAPDFFPVVKALFKDGETTYDDVQEKLGTYLYKCEPTVTQADGTAYFVCRYDFKGDEAFPVVFFFTENGVLMRLVASVGDTP